MNFVFYIKSSSLSIHSNLFEINILFICLFLFKKERKICVWTILWLFHGTIDLNRKHIQTKDGGEPVKYKVNKTDIYFQSKPGFELGANRLKVLTTFPLGRGIAHLVLKSLHNSADTQRTKKSLDHQIWCFTRPS